MSKTQLKFSLADNIGNDLSFITEADIIKGSFITIISFTEQTDLELKTKIIIYNNHVELSRNGLISMLINFKLDEITKVIVKSSYGHEIIMDNYTKELRIKNNSIYIIYQTSEDISKDIIHTLQVEWGL